MIDGLAVVDKPSGCTSHDVVARCRRIFGQRRVGHAGTLDPDATGLLLVGLGQSTRLLQFLTGLDKSYDGEVVLGVATSTLDASGDVVGVWDMSGVTLDEARREARDHLTGTIEQVPPMVSAIKIGGRRLHELARAGIEVERPSRTVTVTRFDLGEAIDPAPGHLGGGPIFSLRVDCSSGTYVRTLAADLGCALGGGGHLRNLRRVRIGPFTLADAVSIDDLDASHVIPPAGALRNLHPLQVPADVAEAVGHGKVLDLAVLGATGAGPWPVIDADGALLAVYEVHGAGRAKPAVVVPAPAS